MSPPTASRVSPMQRHCVESAGRQLARRKHPRRAFLFWNTPESHLVLLARHPAPHGNGTTVGTQSVARTYSAETAHNLRADDSDLCQAVETSLPTATASAAIDRRGFNRSPVESRSLPSFKVNHITGHCFIPYSVRRGSERREGAIRNAGQVIPEGGQDVLG